jgi:ubiquinone/menaquinone biosynthesis C-methylase UbiE
MSVLLIAASAVALAAAFIYWTVVISEGAYFGRRLVTFLYDRGATTYDEVKEFDAIEDAWFIGIPLARRLEPVASPHVLDVATGTGRVALSLLRQLSFDGHVVGLDVSPAMLAVARDKVRRYTGRVHLVRQDATRLPFIAESFDAVACVEALEFMPEPKRTLSELVRVLRPGGAFLVTNRVGWERFFLPGRALTPDQFELVLRDLGLVEIWTKPWQTYYDLIWARKPGELKCGGEPFDLVEVLGCPVCGQRPLHFDGDWVTCRACGCNFCRAGSIINFEVCSGRDEAK